MMYEKGMCFVDIASVFKISASDVGIAVVDVQIAKRKFKNKEKVVYRKRVNKCSRRNVSLKLK